jgi:hypothetical protein
MTVGNGASAKVRLIVWCRDCRHQIEPHPAEIAKRYCAEMTASDSHSALSAPAATAGRLILWSPEPSGALAGILGAAYYSKCITILMIRPATSWTNSPLLMGLRGERNALVQGLWKFHAGTTTCGFGAFQRPPPGQLPPHTL